MLGLRWSLSLLGSCVLTVAYLVTTCRRRMLGLRWSLENKLLASLLLAWHDCSRYTLHLLLLLLLLLLLPSARLARLLPVHPALTPAPGTPFTCQSSDCRPPDLHDLPSAAI